MKSGYPSPEAWLAVVLRDEIEQLQCAVRKLEHNAGYWDGVAEARVAS
ncbi:hypothetical protein PP637_gp55 [Arthrobacter phage Persistence]|uniref:Uncharacterized protein n=1 Tax=Arthrobacter phage Persistence TaxID=2836007 RepID=A0A8F3E2U5_9CAUD|nr:hypothetical protein PP637_gp55 [Arthrobacter phage Persistence]QWY79684.1 hypothetical protein SEA_PERSISTENCE_55 [Arthrobacter phage Persistence]